MKKYLLIYIICSSFILFSTEGCSNKMLEVKNVWPENDINIDGSITDWQEIPVIDDDNIFNFKLCNDNDYLYTVFYSRDIHLGGQIKMTGVKLWIDNTGGKNKKTGLFFSGGPELSHMIDSGRSEDHFREKEKKSYAEDRSMNMELMGEDKFTIIDNKGDVDILSKDGINGPAIAYGISNGTIIYELKIPLRIKGLESYVIGANPGDKISICLELQGRGKPEGMEGMPPRGEPPGGGSMPGGGMPPGGGGGPGRGMPPGGAMPEETKKEIWLKILLTSK